MSGGHRATALLLIASCIACSAVVAPSGRVGTIAEERAVYALVLAHVRESDSTRRIAVDSIGLSAGADSLVGWKERLFERRRGALRAMLASVTATPYRVDTALFPPSSLDAGSATVSERNARLAVSRVVVAPGGRLALVDFSFSCGNYCGWGGELWLALGAGGTWSVEREFTSWME